MERTVLLLLACASLTHAQVFADEVLVEGDISIETTWTANNSYLLRGFVHVTSGTTLTIEPGTVIKGETETKGTLIIARGAQLIADGTAIAPIVFTSAQPPGLRAIGDWGGLILCGRAPVNLPGGEGVVPGGVDAVYGGSDADDNSGILRFLRIEFPGIAFQPNMESNGLTLAGVGRATIVDHVQVSYSGDDSFEFLGGTVDARHLYAYAGVDDDLGMTEGYSGRVQFAVSLRDPGLADQSGSNGLENDNDPTGTDATPHTTPVISNVSLFGPQVEVGTVINTNYKRANHLRRNTHSRVFNSVFAGFPVGLLIDGALCEANCDAGTLKVSNNVYSAMATLTAVAVGSTWDVGSWFNENGNSAVSDNTALGYADPFNLASPDFTLDGASSLNTGADFSDTDLADPFFEQVSYQGAFGATDWTPGWSNTDPQNTPYAVAIEERALASTVSIFPDPLTVGSQLNLYQAPHAALTLQFFDVRGRLARERRIGSAGGRSVPLGNDATALESGFYLLRIIADGFQVTTKVMVP